MITLSSLTDSGVLAVASDSRFLSALPKLARHACFPDEKHIWVTIDGKITIAEYRKFLARGEEIITDTSPISFLVNLDDLEGVEIGAMIGDTKFGFAHIKDFKLLALVGDQKWIKRLTSLPNPFALEAKPFDEDEELQAWDWITS